MVNKMLRTAIVYSEGYLDHDPRLIEPDHPESPKRLTAVMERLGKVLGDPRMKLYPPEPADETTLLKVHSKELVDAVRTVCERGGGRLDVDTIASANTYDTALLAVGGALRAGELVVRNEVKSAFALVRPPGHHAGRSKATGFCFFNNVAVLAEYLHQKRNLKRIEILDLDAHFGNGTAEIFYDKPYVLYLGLHQDGRTCYPGTGFPEELGRGEGEGYTVNVPLPPLSGDLIYMKVLKEIVSPVSDQFAPEVILVSAGFDAHYLDQLTSMNLSCQGFGKIAGFITGFAKRVCDEKVVAVLEGGYSLVGFPKSVVNFVLGLSNLPIRIRDNPPRANPWTLNYVERLLKRIKKILSPYWAL